VATFFILRTLDVRSFANRDANGFMKTLRIRPAACLVYLSRRRIARFRSPISSSGIIFESNILQYYSGVAPPQAACRS